MPHVTLTGNLVQLTGGEADFQFDARNVREVLNKLIELHPVLEPHLGDSIAVAIDGEIFQDAWFAEVRPDSEVHIMPRIAGG